MDSVCCLRSERWGFCRLDSTGLNAAYNSVNAGQRIRPMAPKSVRIRVLNSLLVIRDENSRDFPDIDRTGVVWSSPSCILVGCMPDCDGETHVTIGHANEIRQDGKLIFDSRLETPSRSIIIHGVV